MTNKKEFLHHYRDAEADGNTGVIGFFRCFMDVACEYMYFLGMGNDILPRTHKSAWLYTKYRLTINERIGFEEPMQMETWISSQSAARVCQDLEISYKGRICCAGRMESCLFNIEEQAMKPVSYVGFPDNVKIDRKADVQKFSRPKPKLSEMEEIYRYKVRYSDIDQSRHVSNLRYIPLFMDAFDMDFHTDNFIYDAEIHFISQGFYGDELKICRKINEDDSAEVVAAGDDGRIVAWFKIYYRKNN